MQLSPHFLLWEFTQSQTAARMGAKIAPPCCRFKTAGGSVHAALMQQCARARA